MALHLYDWLFIGSYLAFALVVGLVMKNVSSKDPESYFLANRNLPWWWAGISIAATTFAADTPLAITGIIATRGFSGNWIWLSWMAVHALVIVIFAAKWRQIKVLTDAEMISVRYSGRSASILRYLRASIYGLIFNGIILGWVLKAMVKIVSPFFKWEIWTPGLVSTLTIVWPENSTLGSVSDGITILSLILIVVIYSTFGGIRGVIFTDLVQFLMAIVGSFYFAFKAWDYVGGKSGLLEGLNNLYGAQHNYLDFFPGSASIFPGFTTIAGILFVTYLFVQSYSNMPADGGGYLMQRLACTRNPREAQKASLLFLLIQYLVRLWPWVIVALVALIVYPLNTAADGLVDREMAYPLLMGRLLGPGMLGLLITSLLAAFMSTVDTHINWGASYLVNDFYCRIFPNSSVKSQIRVARLSVILFGAFAIFIAFHISTIEQAWKWVAVIGAALGIPTLVRWLWWRVSALSELIAILAGLTCTVISWNIFEVQYEISLILISLTSLLAMLLTIGLSKSPDKEKVRQFMKLATPKGIWPDRTLKTGVQQILSLGAIVALVIGGTISVLYGTHGLLFREDILAAIFYLLVGILFFSGLFKSFNFYNKKAEDEVERWA